MDAEKTDRLGACTAREPLQPGEVQKRHFLSILCEGAPTAFDQGSGRMQLAEAIVKQPLAMRVYVNRIWKTHFGTGIVDTPSNFGFAGERPTNAELLEYLAQCLLTTECRPRSSHARSCSVRLPAKQ